MDLVKDVWKCKNIRYNIEYHTNKPAYIPFKFSGFPLFSRWYATVHRLFTHAFWNYLKIYQSSLSTFYALSQRTVRQT